MNLHDLNPRRYEPVSLYDMGGETWVEALRRTLRNPPRYETYFYNPPIVHPRDAERYVAHMQGDLHAHYTAYQWNVGDVVRRYPMSFDIDGNPVNTGNPVIHSFDEE